MIRLLVVLLTMVISVLSLAFENTAICFALFLLYIASVIWFLAWAKKPKEVSKPDPD